MAVSYTYAKNLGVHTITNTGAPTLTYTITRVSCDASPVVKTGTILTNETAVISPFILDGKYTVLLDDGTDEAEFNILYYNFLLTSFIEVVQATLCGCTPCKDCEECNECEDYLSGFIKAFAFQHLNLTYYNPAVVAASAEIYCTLNDEVLCSLLHEKVYGNSELKLPMKQILALYYLAFYSQDLTDATPEGTEEIDYINSKYKIALILPCIKRLGINASEVIINIGNAL